MKNKQQPQRWIFATLAAFLCFILLINQINNDDIYQSLQQKFAQAGISLQAKSLDLSAMYLGSIRLDHVEMKSTAFQVSAQRLFIDLDLAALLTGKAIAQALYLQRADISISETKQSHWLSLIKTEQFKLKRIDISQSEIHFDEQHITLEHADLDIRDIGKNQNPRLEMKAHIGEGRLEAHGYLRLRRGEITRGFSRLKLHDIPLQALVESTVLQKISGSITTHINQDQTWQAFGHLAAKDAVKDQLTLRGKFSGSQDQVFHIADLVLSVVGAGAVSFSGACSQWDDCQINSESSNLKLSPLLAILNPSQSYDFDDAQIKQLHVQSTWKNKQFSSLGEVQWNAWDHDNIHLDAGTLQFHGLKRLSQANWQLKHATLFENTAPNSTIALDAASFKQQQLVLPLTLQDSPHWQPLFQLAQHLTPQTPIIHGKGNISGTVNVLLDRYKLQQLDFDLNASNAELIWNDAFKPASIPFKAEGTFSPPEQQLSLSVQLADAYSSITSDPTSLSLSQTTIHFDHLTKLGIKLPMPWQQLHGKISGKARMTGYFPDMQIASIDAKLAAFGFKDDTLNGDIHGNQKKWIVKELTWQHHQGIAHISINSKGWFQLVADRWDAEALLLMQKLPFLQQGSLNIQAWQLPFATLQNVSSQYELQHASIRLSNLKSTLYQGNLRAKQINISTNLQPYMKQQLSFSGKVQLGNVHVQDWLWLQKQFDTHLEGNLYATMHVDGTFTEGKQLVDWQGNGDISVFNAQWLLNKKNMQTKQLNLSFKKRHQFHANFTAKHLQSYQKGNIIIDEKQNISGQFQAHDVHYQLSKSWPKLEATPTP